MRSKLAQGVIALVLAISLTVAQYSVASEISSSDYSETAASNNAAVPNGAPEGMAPSGTNDTIREIMSGLKKFWNRINAPTSTTGSANAYVLTPAVALAAYVDGENYCAQANFTNTASATLNISALGAKTFKKYVNGAKADLEADDIISGQPVCAVYDGTDMVLQTTGGQGAMGLGSHTIWVPASAMTSRTTNGCESATTELATNDVMLATMNCNEATDEAAQFMIAMPTSWDEGTITTRFLWTAASGSGDVIWALRCVAWGDDDALDAAYGTAQTATDTLLAANDNHITSATSAITVAGTPASGDLMGCEAYRDANAAGDTLAVDAKLIGVKILVTITGATDS